MRPRAGFSRSLPRAALYSVHRVDKDRRIVWIVDDGGAPSVTNDAERVTAEVHDMHPGYRIIYRDTMMAWDELKHVNGSFTGYAPARNMTPEMCLPVPPCFVMDKRIISLHPGPARADDAQFWRRVAAALIDSRIDQTDDAQVRALIGKVEKTA